MRTKAASLGGDLSRAGSRVGDNDFSKFRFPRDPLVPAAQHSSFPRFAERRP